MAHHERLSQIAAPFYCTFDSGGAVFNAFYAFCQRYMPFLFGGDQEGGTASRLAQQAAHLHAHNLLAFHDPQLCLHLDASRPGWWQAVGSGQGCVPAAWLTALFAPVAPVGALCRLWDEVLVQRADSPGSFPALLLVAALVSQRDSLLDGSCAVEAATKTALAADVAPVVQLVRVMARVTPPSVREEDSRALLALEAAREARQGAGVTASPAQQQQQRGTPQPPPPGGRLCVSVDADAVVPQLCRGRAALTSPVRRGGYAPMRFFVVDCRSVPLRRAGRLATVFHIDPASLPGLTRGASARPRGDSVVSTASSVLDVSPMSARGAPIDDIAQLVS